MISIKAIDRNEALRYLGYGETRPEENILKIIDDCEKQLLEVISPKYLYSCFDIIKNGDDIALNQSELILTGKDIKNHLDGCDRAILMCATLSAKVDRLIRSVQITDMTSALIMDSLANAAIEQICDLVEKEIQIKSPSLYKTWRFSPGYGDFPVDIQNDFLKALDAPKKIGLCTNKNSILVPKKSVTAVIGLSQHEIERKKKGCLSCNLNKTCIYRKKGEHCGF